MGNTKGMDKKMDALERYVRTTLPTIIGVEAVNHFKESFVKEGFTDKNLSKWEQVKRRENTSPWYGYQYGKKGISNAATTRKVLTGVTGDLQNSIQWKLINRGVRVFAATPYAKIQNEGGTIKVFGKASAVLPARKFMGDSHVLRKRIVDELIKDFKRIMR